MASENRGSGFRPRNPGSSGSTKQGIPVRNAGRRKQRSRESLPYASLNTVSEVVGPTKELVAPLPHLLKPVDPRRQRRQHEVDDVDDIFQLERLEVFVFHEWPGVGHSLADEGEAPSCGPGRPEHFEDRHRRLVDAENRPAGRQDRGPIHVVRRGALWGDPQKLLEPADNLAPTVDVGEVTEVPPFREDRRFTEADMASEDDVLVE